MSADSDARAKALIDGFVQSLRDLSGDEPIPIAWLDYVKQNLWPKEKPGPKPDETLELDIGMQILAHRIAYGRGQTTKKISEFAEDLAHKYGKDRSDIFRIEKKWRTELWSAEIVRRLQTKETESP